MAARTVFIDSALSNYQSVATQYDAAVFNVVLLNSASPHAEQIQSWMKSNGVNAADINIVSASTSVNGAFTPRVVFVDASIADLGTVIAGVPANATVVVLDAGRDGVQQIHDYLAANSGTVGAIDIVTDLASVDVVSHGAPGQVMLGSTVLNADTLAQYSSQLAEIGSHLTAGADLLLYGCDIASGATGQQFITALAAATGADVAASTDLTGSAAAGGDWNLEANTGTIETAALNIAGYDALLAAAQSITGLTMENDADPGAGILTNKATQTISVNFSANGNADLPTIWVSTDGNGNSRVQVPASNIQYNNGSKTGSFTVSVTLQEGAGKSIQFWNNSSGNNGVNGTFVYTLDRTPPATPSITGFSDNTGSTTDTLTNDTTPTLTITAEADSTVQVFRNGVSVGYATQTATKGTYTFTSVTLADGSSQNFTATAMDAAGNQSGVSLTQNVSVDTTAPAASLTLSADTGTSGTDGVTKNASLNFNPLEAGASRVIKVDGATVTAYDASKLLDGPHTVSVTDTDAAGNVATASATFTLDTRAPTASVTLATDTGTSGTDGLTNNAALNFGALEAGATRVIKVDGVAGAYTPANLADGQHTVEVTDTDAAGNAGTSSVTFTLDTTLTTPTVKLAQDTGVSGSDGVTSKAALTIGAADPGAVRVIKLDNQVVSGYDPSGLAEGAHTVSITDTDAAGNTRTASAAFTLDTKAPVTSATLVTDTGSSGADGLTSNAGVSFGALESGATRVVKVDGAVVAAYDPTKLADGQHTVEVADTDAAGNVGTSSVAFMLDKTSPAPTAPLAHDTGRSGQDGATSNAALTIAALEAGASRVIKVDGAVVAAYDPTALADGQHTVELADTDGAGNTGTSSTTFILDTKAPVTTAALSADTGTSGTDGLTSKAGLTLGALESGATRVITVDGTVVANYDAAALADGKHTVDVADTDAAGNVGTASVTFTLDTTAPAPTAPLAHDTGSSSTDGVTSNAALTVAALEAGASRVIKVDGSVVAAYDPTSLADGQHTVELADTDGAGNTGTSSTTFTLDTKAPVTSAVLATDTGSSGADGLTSNAGVSFGALETGATRVITVDGTAGTAYDPTKLAEGQHTVDVADTDAAGNVGKASVAFVLDTKAPTPAAPLTQDTGSSDHDGTSSNAALTFSALEAGATRAIKVDGAVVAAYDPTTLADGSHTVELADTDGAGNTGTSSTTFILDTKAPAPTASLANDTGTSGTDSLTRNAGLTLGVLETGATRVVTVDGTVVNSYDAAALGDGKHTVDVADTDAAGNVGTASVTFTLDTTAPAPTAPLAHDTGSSSTDGVTSNAALTVAALEGGATRIIKIDGAIVAAYDPAMLTDGSHTVELADTDGAGNTGTSSTTFSLDTKAPSTSAALADDTGSSHADGLTSNAGVNFGAMETGATRVITVDGAAVTAYDPTTLTDGQHTVEVADTDAAGNTGTSSVAFLLDTKAPTPAASLAHDTGSSDTDGTTSNAALTLGALETGATRVIKVDGAVVATYDPATLADGSHTVELADTDGAGNTGTSSTTFILDTKAPVPTASLATDTGTSGTDGLTRNAGLTLGALETGATRVITVDGTVVNSYDAAALADGKHTVDVADTDAAGNVGTASVAFTLDTTAPAPTAPLAHDTGGSSTDGVTSNAALTVAALEAGATRVIKVDGSVVAAYDPTSLADGSHTVELADTDGAGNTGTSTTTFILDTKAPVPTAALTADTGTSGTDGLTRNAGLTLGALETGATRVVTVDGAVVNSYDAAALADGKHTVDVADTDAAGNVGTASVTFTLDTTAPAPTAPLAHDTGSSSTDGVTSNAALTVAALEAGATRVIKVDGAVVTAYDPTKLTDGNHTVELADTDGAGNTGTSSTTFTLDTKAPVTSAVLATDTGSSGADGLTSNAGVSFGTLEAGATRVITVDGAAVTAYDPTTLTDGQHTVEVADTDAAGNTGTSSAAFLLDTKAPTPAASLAHDTGSSTTDGTTSNAALTIAALETGASRVVKVDGAIVAAYDPAALADGSHTVELADTDGAGNTGTSTTTFILDTKAPVPTASLANDTGTSGTDGLTRNAGLTLGALESGATRVITVDGTMVNSYDAAALADGKHTVDVADTDAAGNVGTASVTFTLDTTAPAPTAPLAHDTGSSSTDGVTSNAALTVAALEAGASRVIKVDGAVVTAYDPTKLADGNHTVELADTDGAGNTATSSTTFTLDTKAPSTSAALADDTGSSHADGLTSHAGVNFGAMEAGATRVITVDGAAVTAYDLATLTDGQHAVEVADTDAAGNTGTSSVAFMLDTKAPTPAASLAHDTGSSNTDGTTSNAALTLAALETGATRVIKVDGAVVAAYDPATLADGSHTVELADTDGAGNTGTSSTTFILDTKAPVTTAALSADTGTSDKDGVTSNAALSLGALESGATRVITVDGNVVAAYDATKLADGKHTVDVADTDAAGNVSKASVAFTLDTTTPTPTAPLAHDTGGSSTDGVTSSAALTIAALEAGASRVIKVDGAVVAAYDPTKLADGNHTVELADTDAAGNTGTSSTTFTLDTKAPATSAALTKDTGGSDKDGLTSDAALTLGALESGATRVITVDGSVVGAYDASTLANGKHTVDIADTDAAGNVGKSSVVFTLDTQAPAPTVKLATDSGANAADSLTNNAGLTIAALESGASRVVKVDGNTVAAYDPAALAEGQHTVEVTDTDGAGNAGKSAATFILDSKGPVFSSAGSATVAENIGENKLVYKALAADAHGVSFSLGGADAAKFDIAADGAVTLKENPNYEAVNAYAFTVVATDNAGNHTDQAVALAITNVNEAPVATSISKSTIENAQLSFQVADYISDPDLGDKLGVSLGTATATLSWMNTDPAAPKTIINPVTKAVVDLSTLTVKASLSADGSTVTLTPPTELDWLATGQAVKASFSYTVTDAAGSTSQEKIDFVMNGSTNDKGVNLSGGNGDDNLAGNATNNAEDVLNGGNGNDTLSGFGGTDALYGGNGDDKLSGGVGIDYLYGDSGNDTIDGGLDGDYIFGGKGNDVLTGGGGADKFVFAPQGGSDRITDFRLADGDKLFFADFFSTAITVDAFLQKYVTDTGNDLLINLQGTQIVVVGVANVSDLAGAISFGVPA